MLWLVVNACGFAQVSNNNIQNRIALKLDAGWYTSSTVSSSVEWDCINKALTNKCLIYHNDQWFTVKPQGTGPLFLNISNQVCKKQLGVQMVIIEGDPCKTDSYRLKKCVPFTDQSDFFVRLDSLDPRQEYLINIDGYLGDLCSFEIAFSSTAAGIPIESTNLDVVNLSILQNDSLVSLRWQVHDSLSFNISAFHVYRKKKNDKRAFRIAIPMAHNAYGAAQERYEFIDTLRQNGEYTYSIYGSSHNDVVLLGRQNITYKAMARTPVNLSYIMPLDYTVSRSGMVSVSVSEENSGKHLFSGKQKAAQGNNTMLLNLKSFVAQGILNYKVVISQEGKSQEHFVRFSEDGGVRNSEGGVKGKE